MMVWISNIQPTNHFLSHPDLTNYVLLHVSKVFLVFNQLCQLVLHLCTMSLCVNKIWHFSPSWQMYPTTPSCQSLYVVVVK